MSKLVPFDPVTSPWLQRHPNLGMDLMTHLFSRLDAKYPGQWRSRFDGIDAIQAWKEVWAETFEREGISPADVRLGLSLVSTRHPSFPPTEGEFLACCRPPVDYEASFAEAVEQLRLREIGKDRWSHPAIYWASVAIGAFDMRNATWDRIQRRWVAALDKALANRPYVEVPAADLPALPAPGKCSVSPEEAKRRIAELKARLRSGPLARCSRSEAE